MNKYPLFVITLFLMAGGALSASPVDKSRAREIAGNLMKVRPDRLKEVAARQDVVVPMSASEPAYYVFNKDGGGFTIVAADDLLMPVLGFSSVGSFTTEGMPDNVRSFLRTFDDRLEKARFSDEGQSAEVAAAWEAMEASGPSYLSSGDRLVLRTAKWSQESPYNLMCPQVSGQNCVTGCVATAMAILIRFNEYPDTRTATIPGYDCMSIGKHINDITGTTNYVWANLPYLASENPNEFGEYSRIYTGSYNWSNDEMSMISTLMYECGVMVQMSYGLRGSAANSYIIPNALHDYLGYSGSTKYDRWNFTEQKWRDKVLAELGEGYPVLYDGQSLSGGHQFIIDGYKNVEGETYFHFNFGWNGIDDGFYLLDNIEYPYEQGAIVSVRKNPDLAAPLYLLFFETPIVSVTGDVQNGSEFRVSFLLWNSTPTAANYTWRMLQIGSDGTVRSVCTEANGSKGAWAYGQTICDVTFEDEVFLGDKLVLQVAHQGNSDFETLTVRETGGEPYEFPLIDMKFIDPARIRLCNDRKNASHSTVSENQTEIKALLSYEDGWQEKIVYKK